MIIFKNASANFFGVSCRIIENNHNFEWIEDRAIKSLNERTLVAQRKNNFIVCRSLQQAVELFITVLLCQSLMS